jgi:hypothetical protein
MQMYRRSELLKSMLLEEWRIHSTLFGNMRFALLPVAVIIGSILCSLLMNLFKVFFSIDSMLLFTHYSFFLFGANVGAFGMVGREFMNRRFGQASLLAYSSRILPLSERLIFTIFVIKDIIYYFFLWIIPIILGFAIASPILGINPGIIPMLLVSLSLSFLLGLSIVFFLSMIYARSIKLLILMMVCIIAAMVIGKATFYTFPPYLSFIGRDILQAILSLIMIAILCTVSILFVKLDFPVKKNAHKNLLQGFDRFFNFYKNYSVYVAKDIIDLLRSNGGLGKVFFSFLIPMGLTWIFVSFVTGYIGGLSFLVLFSIFLGIFSSTVYNWLTEYDLFNQYLLLPIKVSTIMKSKLMGYAFINILSILIILFSAIAKGELAYFAWSILIFCVTSLFALSATMLYTGLLPSIRFMDVKVLFKYFATIIPLVLIWMIAYFFGTIYLIIGGIGLLIISIFMMKRAFEKWEMLSNELY